MTIGEKILNMRKARSWSQEELADRAGVSRQAVSRWESGSAKPDADKIIVLCDLFGISADYLLREDYSGEKKNPPEEMRKPDTSDFFRRKALKLYAALSALCLFGIKFISSVSPKVYVNKELLASGETVTRAADGLLGFVMYYNLEWFLVLLLIGIALGIVLLWQGSPFLRKRTEKLWNRLKGMRGK